MKNQSFFFFFFKKNKLHKTERFCSPLPAYICALQKEVPYHGRLYITDTHACFFSSVLLKDTKVFISSDLAHHSF